MGGGGVLIGILDRSVPPGSPNPDAISDQNIPFSTPVFRPDVAVTNFPLALLYRN